MIFVIFEAGLRQVDCLHRMRFVSLASRDLLLGAARGETVPTLLPENLTEQTVRK